MRRIKLVLRDDDLSFFTDPKNLEQFYGDVWSQHPILFAAVPMIGRVPGAAPLFVTLQNHGQERRSIADNTDLVHFLRERIGERKIEIAQHGYSHEDNIYGYELESRDFPFLLSRLTEGKKILESTFLVRVDTFVPPHDRISRQGVLAVKAAGFKYINRGLAPLPREVQWGNGAYLRSYARVMSHYFRYGKKFRYPHPLDFGGHEEIYSYRIEGLTKENIPHIIQHAAGGTLSVTFHYRYFSLIHRDILLFLLEKVREFNEARD